MQHLVDLVTSRLQISSPGERTILDIGGGTGNFAQALVEGRPNVNAIVVDPFLDPTTSSSNAQVQFVKQPAEAFLEPRKDDDWWRRDFHQVLLKEIVHHLHPHDRVGIFRGMRQELTPVKDAPALLIITRPQIDIDYPLWDAARHVWKDNQPSASEFEEELKQAGFSNVETTLEAYPCQIALDRWQTMVRGRFWSTFSKFTDDELEEACELIAKEYAGRITPDGILPFEDRLVFISAYV